MNPPDKPLTDTEIDALYGLEPALDAASGKDTSLGSEFVTVNCPYCGEPFETSADASGGACKYVEDCQICCQPIDMELRVDAQGAFEELVASRGDQ